MIRTLHPSLGEPRDLSPGDLAQALHAAGYDPREIIVRRGRLLLRTEDGIEVLAESTEPKRAAA